MSTFEVIRDANEITSPKDFVRRIAWLRGKSPGHKVLFRGHGDSSYQLIPTIGRPLSFAGQTAKLNTNEEKRLLLRFRRSASQRISRELTPWENIFLARYYRIPVRLLAWTFAPLTAMCYACKFFSRADFRNDKPPDGKIWVLVAKCKQKNTVFKRFDDPLDVRGIRLLSAPIGGHPDSESEFVTIQENPWVSIDQLAGVVFHDSRLDVVRLIEFIVPRDKRAEWLMELHKRGVSRSSIVPDLHGLAAGLINLEILRCHKRDTKGRPCVDEFQLMQFERSYW